MRLDEFHNTYTQKAIEKGVFIEEETISLTGRIMSIRASGAKLLFLDLHGDEHKV
jgi:lysyl-tRNA synthetase class II